MSEDKPPEISTTPPPEGTAGGGVQFRRDGIFWRCFAVDGEGGEQELGAMLVAVAHKYPERRHEFRVLMLECFAEIIFEQYGVRPRINPAALKAEQIKDHGFPTEGNA